MNYINDTTQYVTDTLDKNTTWLNNPTVIMVLTLALLVYAVFFAGRFAPETAKIFDHPLVKIAVFLLIIYVANRNVGLGMAFLIAFFAVLSRLNSSEPFDEMQASDYPSASDYIAPNTFVDRGDTANEVPEQEEEPPMSCPVSSPHAPQGKLDVLDNDSATSNYAPALF